MLLWPAVAALGFIVLTVVVIALAASSTARYDFERNRVGEARAPSPAASPAAPSGGRARARRAGSGAPRDGARGGGAPVRRSPSARLAASVATHPAGRGMVAPASATGWWLLDHPDGAPARVLAGPFGDRLDADWAALAQGLTDDGAVRVVHGARTVSGALLPRPAPQDGDWMLELGQQLTRLPEDWFDLIADTDPLTTLVVEVAEALIEAGLPLHDCTGRGPAGGVCLTPYPQRGILVGWHGHDRMTLQQLAGAPADAAVRQTMSAAVADVLAQRGFQVAPVGWSSGHLVTTTRR